MTSAVNPVIFIPFHPSHRNIGRLTSLRQVLVRIEQIPTKSAFYHQQLFSSPVAMPSMSNINKRDETASKPDTGKYGLEPFMGGGGYALVVCCPVYTVVGIVTGIKHQIKKRKQKKAGAQENEGQDVPGEPAGEKERATEDEPHKPKNADTAGEKKSEDGSSPPGIKRSVSPPRVTHGFKGDPNNPRICNPECPGFGKGNCAVHQRAEPDRPASPGLLAV